MNPQSSSESFSSQSGKSASLDKADLETAGFIRLISRILDEPAELVAIALKARLPIVAALTAESSKAA